MAFEEWVYADESGMHEEPAYCLMAGYIGSARQWKIFVKDWKGVLDKYRVPEFHARDFFQRTRRRTRKYYKDWSIDKAIRFAQELSDAIHYRDLRPICGAVNAEAWRAWPYGLRRFWTGGSCTSDGKWTAQGAPSQPYRFVSTMLIREAIEHAKPDTRVHFVFDRQNVVEGGQLLEFQDFVNSGMGPENLIDTTRLGDLVFANRFQRLQLQAADMLAYVWQTQFTKGRHPTLEQQTAMNVLSQKRETMYVFHADDLEGLVADGIKAGIDMEMIRRMGPNGLSDSSPP